MGRLCSTVFLVVALGSCGGSDDPESPPPPAEWIRIESVTAGAASADMSGTAWVSKNWSGYRCIGLLCTNTDDFPGVRVTWSNETGGTGGDATSFFGGGTRYEHRWRAIVRLVPGRNVIRLLAYDPSGRGVTLTTEATAATAVQPVKPEP